MRGGAIDFPDAGRAVQWAVATRAKVDGFNGDGFLLNRDDERIIATTIDGIGSGREAHAATAASVEALQGSSIMSLEQRFNAVHRTLEGGRGAAMGIAEIEVGSGAMQWAAVGDIDGYVIKRDGATGSMLQRGGTLGFGYTSLHVVRAALSDDDLVIITSDGISRRFRDAIPRTRDPDMLSNEILDVFGRENDDCIVLVLKLVSS